MLGCVSATLCRDDKMYFTKIEISLGSRMISMEFAVSTKVLWPWFCKKRKHQKKKKPLSTILHLLWNVACFWCRGVTNIFSTYTTNETTRQVSERLILVVSGAYKETSWFGNVELTLTWTAGLYSHSVFCPIYPYWFWTLIQLGLGREYDFWTPAALRFSLEISYAGSY